MLHELHVVDLGIVADLDLLVTPGLTAITGETGAGKTLLVEALDLLVGGRADASLVRDGADEARIEGRFVDPESGNEVVLTRVVPRDGRSRAYIDGRLATVGELSDRGASLVDLHGQHAHQSLLDPSVQRGALDRFSGAPAIDALAEYRTARAEVRAIDDDLTALGGDERARAREIDLLRFQVDEIATAAIANGGEEAVLEAEETLLADAVAHREALGHAHDALEGAGLDALGDAVTALAGRAPFAELEARIRAAQAELDDVAQELRVAGDRVTDDPERLDQVRRRRQQLRELCRKYGDTLDEVVAYGQATTARLAELEGFEARAQALESRRAGARKAELAAAERLSAARRTAAEPLAAAIEVHLRELAMPAASITVEVEPGDATDDGVDRVTFLLAPNPGESARTLARAASGGELSRAMLAARVVLTAAPPTLVFDEIDAGIGGEAGLAVGRLLATLARRHQVLCVTHLAQVAAFADTQVVVEKAVVESATGAEAGERTIAHARVVDGDARVGELSRMLAGVGESDHARRHADELLDTAQSVGELMALRLRRRSRTLQPLEGVARVDRRTKDLLKRIQPREIAVIRHENLDRVAADGLVEAGVLVVINAAPSTTGRYPNIGPLRVVEAGIPLIDVDNPKLLDEIPEGSMLRVSGGEVWCDEKLVAEGHVMTTADLEERLEAARNAIGVELELFAENTLEYIHREARLFFEPLTLPELRTQCQGRHALVVVRGHDYRSDLGALRPYMREYKPVLIGVDGGADALLEFGFKPDIIIGDFDSVSERALHCGAELVHHVHPDGRAPGREELADFGVDYQEFVAEGTSEDVAMLLAFEQRATLIVAVGTHATMVEFLDKGRRGMASTFLTRLRLGPMLVDAKGVNSLYQGRVRRLDIFLLVGAALVAMVVVGIVAEPIHVFLRGFWVTLKDIFGS